MSLLCTETREYIMFGTPLYCGLTKDDRYIYALSRDAVERIAEGDRRPEPCATPEDGLDIHEATSADEPTGRGAYQWSGLKKGAFLFSVSAATARAHLPVLWKECRPGQPSTPPTLTMTVQVFPTEPGTAH